jgi:protein-disulfide isomerase
VGQLFATGPAATYLSADEGVRDILGALLISNYEQVKATDAFKSTYDQQNKTADAIVQLFKSQTAKQPAYITLATTDKLLDPNTTAVQFEPNLNLHVIPNDSDNLAALEKLLGEMQKQ